jgi:hypothetical protein
MHRIKINRFIFIFLVFLLVLPFRLASQNISKETPPLRERLFFGGSLGLQIGGVTDIQLSPVVGIWVLPRLSLAVGPSYRYYKDYYGRTDIIGGDVYTQIVLIQDFNNVIPIGMHMGVFVQLQDELLSLESLYWKQGPVSSDRFYMNTPLAGAGLSQQLGRRVALNMAFLWTLSTPAYDIYSTPEIRVSVVF